MITPENTESTMLDSKLSSIRNDFPILDEQVNNHPLVYLDNAATTQKPNSVIDAISEYYRKHNSNVHRGVHSLSQGATDIYEKSREKLKSFLNARSNEEIIFTKGTTDSLNLAAVSLSHLIEKGDEIICTQMEHHSNFVPWQVMAKERGADFKVANLSESGELSTEELESLFSDKSKILAICHASNTLGTINDIKLITQIAHKHNIIVVVDGAQYIPHSRVDVQDLDCDIYAFSGHKLFGPTGIGVLYARSEILEKMTPYQYGGGMISEVGLSSTTYSKSPQVFEAGTPNIAGTAGLLPAIEYIDDLGYKFIHNHEMALLEYAENKMKAIPGIKFYGTAPQKVSLISFLINDLHPFDLGTMLDQMGIAVRTGHHCTQPIMEYYNISGTVRASFAFYNTFEEVDKLVEGIEKAVKILS